MQIMASTAKFVREAGGQIEIVLRVKQAKNPKMQFLVPGNELHAYFRWLVDKSPEVLVACCLGLYLGVC